MCPRPTKCYIGISSTGDLELVVSQETLAPAGKRLLRGDNFPSAVYDFYEHQTRETALLAIKAMETFLAGDPVTAHSLEFGTKAPKVPRQK